MAAYHIKFIKTLSHEYDHSETVYRSIIIRLARDAVRAVSAAKRRFERLEKITHWRWRADRMKIEPPAGRLAAMLLARHELGIGNPTWN